MNDILFGNNNSEVITKLSKRYFKKNKVRNLAALLAPRLGASGRRRRGSNGGMAYSGGKADPDYAN